MIEYAEVVDWVESGLKEETKFKSSFLLNDKVEAHDLGYRPG
jgi:hypothetical protein